MIDKIIESLHASVEALGIVQKVYQLCEQKETDGKTEIVSYVGKGNYETAFNIDNFNGVAYFRKREDTQIVKKDNETRVCAEMQNVKYSLRFVACIQREELPTDCAFSDEQFAWVVAKELTGLNGALKSSLGANMVYVQAGNISTDRKKILSEEVPGNELVDINYSFSLISIDLEVDLDIQKNCINQLCESY